MESMTQEMRHSCRLYHENFRSTIFLSYDYLDTADISILIEVFIFRLSLQPLPVNAGLYIEQRAYQAMGRQRTISTFITTLADKRSSRTWRAASSLPSNGVRLKDIRKIRYRGLNYRTATLGEELHALIQSHCRRQSPWADAKKRSDCVGQTRVTVMFCFLCVVFDRKNGKAWHIEAKPFVWGVQFLMCF